MQHRRSASVLAAALVVGVAQGIFRTCPDTRTGPSSGDYADIRTDATTDEPISGFFGNDVVLTTCDFMYPNSSYADSGVPCGAPNVLPGDDSGCDGVEPIASFSTKYTEAEIIQLLGQIEEEVLDRGVKIAEFLLDESLPGTLDVQCETTVNVTFLREGACQENALGMFTYFTDDFPPTDTWTRGDLNRGKMLREMNVSIILPTVDDRYCNKQGEERCNLSDENQEFCSDTLPNLSPGTTVRLKPDFRTDDNNFVFPAGISFGFFVVPHASSPTHRLRQDGFGNGEEPEDIPEAYPSTSEFVLFSVPNMQKNPLINAGIAQHSVQYIPSPPFFDEKFNDVLIYSFEDIRRDDDRSNEDFEDVVFMVEVDFAKVGLETEEPSAAPSSVPSASPSSVPSGAPTSSPTASPSSVPSDAPTSSPTASPSSVPSDAPTSFPTESPTSDPSDAPTSFPTESPTSDPSDAPTSSPTASPSSVPSDAPTSNPTDSPTSDPTEAPSMTPSAAPATPSPTLPTTPSSTDTPTAPPMAHCPSQHCSCPVLEAVHACDCPDPSWMWKYKNIRCDNPNLVAGDLCEGDYGICGTDCNLNNCGPYDIYRVVKTGDDVRDCPTLWEVPSSHCPANTHALRHTHCNDATLNKWDYCEVDSHTCGGSDHLNNCWVHGHYSWGYDIYKVKKPVFRSSVMCPALKMLSHFECGPQCDAHTNFGHLPQCNSPDLCVGDLCEADSYSCGTSQHANNCWGYDVYRVVGLPLM